MGLEAVSRGAAAVTFVEKDFRTIEILKKNIAKCGFAEQTNIIRSNAFKVGAPLGFDEEKYSIIFIDPPFPLTRNVEAGSRLSGMMKLVPGQLADDGIVVVRTHKAVELTEKYEGLEIIDRRAWGIMAVTLLGHEKNDQ